MERGGKWMGSTALTDMRRHARPTWRDWSLDSRKGIKVANRTTLTITVLIGHRHTDEQTIVSYFLQRDWKRFRVTDKQPIPHKHITPIFCSKGICSLRNDTMGISINITSLTTLAIAVPRLIPGRRLQAFVLDRLSLHPSWTGWQARMTANTRAVLVIQMQPARTHRMYFHMRTVWSRR